MGRRQLPIVLVLAGSLLPALGGGCTRHTIKVEPVEVKPIHITMDVNLRIQRELDDFFEFEEEMAVPPPPPQPEELEQAVEEGVEELAN